MTVEELLADAIKTLSMINVPVEYHESIGTPLFRVRNNLAVLLQASRQKEAAKQQPEAETDNSANAEEPETQE